MEWWVLAVGAVTVIGLLVALVVLGALMLDRMNRMHHTSSDLCNTVKESQAATHAAMSKLGAALAASSVTAASSVAAAQSQAATQQSLPAADNQPSL